MAPPKIKTLLERMGFADPDLPKPLHDEIIKWLDSNMEDVLMLIFKLQERPKEVKTKWEAVVRLKEDGGMLVGYIDLLATARTSRDVLRVVFEAKTVLGTLGELFRQVRTYQEGFIHGRGVDDMTFVVVCPDASEAEIIRQQGFEFLKYDPETIFKLGAV